MATNLPADEIMMERAIRQAIIDTILPVVAPGGLESFEVAKIHSVQNFSETDDEDEMMSTVADPITQQPRTSVIEIGVPIIDEIPYTSDECTQLNFTYPFMFDLEVFQGRIKSGVVFTSSQNLAIGIYLSCRKALKFNVTLGYENCSHEYLQQDSAVIINDEDSGGSLHAIDWSLSVKATGILV